jgi:glutamate formiminotransferase / 5-formyltetrahydrofolate cyclo-ligase
MLLAVPNVSEGRDLASIEAIGIEFARGAALLDVHSDPTHNRSVFTLSGERHTLGRALLNGALAAIEAIDMRRHGGAHPAIGALDVCPVVWLREADRDAAREEAEDAAHQIAREARVPVFLYGDLATHPRRRERAYFRDGGMVELRRRMATGELRPDYGPQMPHPTAGATLITARQPLAAFNVELRGIDVAGAREVAARLREAGGGLPGVRAIAVDLGAGRVQVSTNVHDPARVPLREVVEQVRRLAAPWGGAVAAGEIVGLVSVAALEGFPKDVPIPGFDPGAGIIERRLPAAEARSTPE